MDVGKRILVLGGCGSGKSTLSVQLARRMGLPVVHLDAEFWQPGWVEPGKVAWRERVAELAAQDAWIMDGCFANTLDIRLPRCDSVILLEANRLVRTCRVVRRALVSYGRVRPDMGQGCPERWDWDFIKYTWDFGKNQWPRLLDKLAEYPEKPVYVLRGRRAAQRFLAAVPETDARR